MPTTLEDIARSLRVSKMTVSRAINNHPEISVETRARILEMAQKMNYRPNQFARALSTNRSYLIGIVVPDLMHSYFAEIEALLSRTDGLIVASASSLKESRFYRKIVGEGAKIVLIDRLLEGLRLPAVTTDDVQVGVLATEHLIQMGHRKIGHLRGTAVSTAVKRFEGYSHELARHGLRFDKDLVRECGFTEAQGYTAMTEWLRRGNVPAAIFAANDPAAIGAMAALSDAGLKIPEDVAIVGGGNIHYGDMLKVPLTTVSWSKTEMGQLASRLLIDLIDGKKIKRKNAQLIVRPELIIRQSCGAAHTVSI